MNIFKNIKNKITISKYNIGSVLNTAFVFFINLYQKYVSPFLGQNCKHYPSCSHYSKDSIHLHGPIKGLLLTVARILRCNPWSLGGFDPVPKTVSFKTPSSFKLTGNYQTQLYKQHEH